MVAAGSRAASRRPAVMASPAAGTSRGAGAKSRPAVLVAFEVAGVSVALDDFRGAGDDGRVPAPVFVHPRADSPRCCPTPGQKPGSRDSRRRARETGVRGLRGARVARRSRSRPGAREESVRPGAERRPGPGETRAPVWRSGEDEPERRPASRSPGLRSAGAHLLLLPPAGGPRREGVRRAWLDRTGAPFREVARAWTAMAMSVEEPHPHRQSSARVKEPAPYSKTWTRPLSPELGCPPGWKCIRNERESRAGEPKPLPEPAGPAGVAAPTDRNSPVTHSPRSGPYERKDRRAPPEDGTRRPRQKPE